MSWIDLYMRSTKELEAPQEYYYWSALAVISAVLKRNVWIDKYEFQVYPCVYILLYGPSGVKKSTVVSRATRVLRKIDDVRVITGRASIEALIEELSARTEEDGGKVHMDAQAYVGVPELSAMFVDAQKAVHQLTNLYDAEGHDTFPILLKSGKTIIKKPGLTFLMASNEENYRAVMPPEATAGGFLSRTSIIYANHSGKLNSLMKEPENLLDSDMPELVAYLKELSKLRGPFVMTSQAMERFDAWYYPYKKEDHSDDIVGISNRIDITMHKLAMILSAARDTTQIIHETDIEMAKQLCLVDVMNGLRRCVKRMGDTTHQKSLVLVMDLLCHGPVSRSQLIRNYSRYFSADDLDVVIRTIHAGCLKHGGLQDEAQGKDRIYIIPEEIRQAWEEKRNDKT